MAPPRFARGLAVACASALLAGCSDTPPVVPEPPTVTVQTPHVWSGTEAHLTSPAFAGMPDADLPAVYLADSLVAVRRADDTTLAVRMPQMNGAVDLQLQYGGRTVLRDSIHVYGLRDAIDGPRISGYILPLPGASPIPAFLAHGETSLVWTDLRSGVIQAFPANMHTPGCTRGPGPTPDPAIVLLSRRVGASCLTARWQLWPSPQLLQDSIPGYGGRQYAQLDSTTFVGGDAHWIYVRRGNGTYTSFRAESVDDMRFSPRGDRLVVHYAYNLTGLPVFGAAERDTAYVIPDEFTSGGGAFSANGDTLFLGGSGKTAPRIFVLDAASGARLATVTLEFPSFAPPQEFADQVMVEDVALDHAQPWLYVLGWVWQAPMLEVVSRSTFETVAVIPLSWDSTAAGAGLEPVPYGRFSRLIVDPLSRVLYVVTTTLSLSSGPARIARLDLPPPSAEAPTP